MVSLSNPLYLSAWKSMPARITWRWQRESIHGGTSSNDDVVVDAFLNRICHGCRTNDEEPQMCQTLLSLRTEWAASKATQSHDSEHSPACLPYNNGSCKPEPRKKTHQKQCMQSPVLVQLSRSYQNCVARRVCTLCSTHENVMASPNLQNYTTTMSWPSSWHAPALWEPQQVPMA